MGGTEANQTSRSTCVVKLTCKNIEQHDEKFSRFNLPGNQAMHAKQPGLYVMGDGSAAARPKTCGLALAMVAIFCLFPGISMITSISHVGLTNQTVTGIVFISFAGALTVASTALCLRSRHLKKASCEEGQISEQQSAAPQADDPNKALLTNRDESHVKISPARPDSCTGKDLIRYERDELQINFKIASSFPLSRYFSVLKDPRGPFDFDKEAMDQATEQSLKCACSVMPTRQHCQFAKQPIPPENSSTDSAIYLDSDTQSIGPVIVV